MRTAPARSQQCREGALRVYPVHKFARMKDKLLTEILAALEVQISVEVAKGALMEADTGTNTPV